MTLKKSSRHHGDKPGNRTGSTARRKVGQSRSSSRSRSHSKSKPAGKKSAHSKLILFNKPFNVLSQFTDENPALRGKNTLEPRATLATFIDVPGVYPCGRLDRDSEGLMVLTNDGRLQTEISNPIFKLEKTYLAQVEGEFDQSALQRLKLGFELKDGVAQVANAEMSSEPGWLWPRTPPIRQRKSIPTSWLRLSLTQGRNRQVRRMTAHLGFPTLRLIRISIGHWTLGDLQPGQWCESSLPSQANGE